jgi:hypothetical protein
VNTRAGAAADILRADVAVIAARLSGWFEETERRAAVSIANVAVIAPLAGLDSPVAAGGARGRRFFNSDRDVVYEDRVFCQGAAVGGDPDLQAVVDHGRCRQGSATADEHEHVVLPDFHEPVALLGQA